MSQSDQKWYKSPAFIGFLLTAAGFGFFTLLFKYLSEWLLSK